MIKNILAYLTLYKSKKSQIKALEKEVETMRSELESFGFDFGTIDENGKATYICGQYILTVTPKERTYVNTKKLEAEHPEIAKEVEYTTKSNEVRVN